MRSRSGRAARLGVVAVVLTAVTLLVVPSSSARSASGYRFLAAAQAGMVYVNDPTFLVPYADQVLTSTQAELSGVGASAVATPFEPGSVVSLVPTLIVVGCPTCPAVPQPVDLEAEARPPANESDEVEAAGATVGPVTYGGPRAKAAAVVDAEASAEASTDSVTGIDTDPVVSSTSSVSHLVAPGSDSVGVVEARATAVLPGATVVAIATVLPEVSAIAGIQQADGSVTPLPVGGMEVGVVVLRPAVESGPGAARAGVVVERAADDGTVLRTTVALASAQSLGSAVITDDADSQAAPPAPAPVDTSYSPAFGALPIAAAPPALPTPTFDDIAPPAFDATRQDLSSKFASSRAAFGRIRERGWIVWVYLGWLVVGAGASHTGRRWLAPRLAAQAAADRWTRAAALDHLDATRRGARDV